MPAIGASTEGGNKKEKERGFRNSVFVLFEKESHCVALPGLELTEIHLLLLLCIGTTPDYSWFDNTSVVGLFSFPLFTGLL